MSAHRVGAVLVAVSGCLPALTLQAWESRALGISFVGWELLLLLPTFLLAALLFWRVSSAVLASWGGVPIASARLADAFTHLPLFLMAGSLAGLGQGFAVMAGLLFVGAKGWVFWHHRPAGLWARALLERGQQALWAGAAAFGHPLSVVVLSLVLVDVRLFHLTADPPVQLGPSGGAWTDPGAWAHNARNKVLFGEWVWDEVNFMYVSPIINLCLYLVFRLLGVGYAQVGLVSVLFSLAALVVFYLSLKEAMGRGGAALATLFLGGSYLFIMYNRVGLVETPAIFFHVLTLYFGQRGTRDARFFALAGASAVMVLAVKVQMAYILPAAVLSVLLSGLRWPERSPAGSRSLRPLGYFLGGGAIAFLLLAVLWIIPYRDQIAFRLTTEWQLYSPPLTVSRLLRNVFYNPFVGYSLGSPVLLGLSGLFFCRLLMHLMRREGPLTFPHLFAFWWFAGGFSYLAISQYRPLRYYVSLIPPMAILAAFALVGLWRSRGLALRPPSPLAAWIYGGGLFVGVLAVVGSAYARSDPFQRLLAFLSLYPLTEKELAILSAVFVLVVSAVTFRFFGSRIPQAARWLSPPVPHLLAVGLVMAFLFTEGRSYLDWKVNRDYRLVSISRQLGSRLPEGSVIAGIFARILTLENRHRSLAIWRRYGNWEGDPLDRFGVTHVAVMAYIDEIGYYHRRFPEAMAHAQPLDEWILWKTRVSLYELPRPEPSP